MTLVIFSQVVVGTSRLDTIEQIGHDPTGMLQWWQSGSEESKRAHTPLSEGWIDSSEQLREFGEV